jgi:hypothetical protein
VTKKSEVVYRVHRDANNPPWTHHELLKVKILFYNVDVNSLLEMLLTPRVSNRLTED